MIKKKIKKKDHENLTATNILKVKNLLNPLEEGQKAITKKEACDILNIAYNTTRLTRVLAEYEEQKAFVSKRKSQNRGKPASDAEICEAVGAYLQGETLSDIAKRLFRSTGFVKAMLEKVGVPSRASNSEERSQIEYFPDECVSEDFAEGEIAWSSTYHSTVVVDKRFTREYQAGSPGLNNFDYEAKYGTYCYSVYVVQKVDAEDTYFSSVQSGGFNACVPAYELGKLEHLKKYGLDLSKM